MKILIVDKKITNECEKALEKEGFYLIKLPPDPSLGEAIASHPDTVMFYSGGEIITTADYCDVATYVFSDLREMVPSIRITFTSDVRSHRYPDDCKMNALIIEKKIFCKTDSISEAITNYAKVNGFEMIHTNQGYPACSVLAFGASAITADPGLASVLSENGVKVTLIGQGSISLPPYEYGFIGGASGVVDNKVYFFGDIKKHPDCDAICDAITNEGFIPVSLSDEPLRDLGGIISL